MLSFYERHSPYKRLHRRPSQYDSNSLEVSSMFICYSFSSSAGARESVHMLELVSAMEDNAVGV